MKVLLMVRKLPGYRYEAFESGFRRLGYSLVDDRRYGREKPESRDDVLCTWNLHRGPDERYAQEWERLGGTVVVCENGYLQREDKTRYAISTHGHNGSGWFPQGNEMRFPALGFEIQPWRQTGDYILVRDQRSIGSALMASPRGWGPRIVAKIKASTNLPVRLMPHPGDKGKLEADLAHLHNARGVAIWSSAIGVRALVEGVRVAHYAPHWICINAAAYGPQVDLAGFFSVKAADQEIRPLMLEHMAHGQWHHEEIATGEPFARMKAEGWGPSWA